MSSIDTTKLRVIHDDPKGYKHVTNGEQILSVFPDDESANTFLRRAIKKPLDGKSPTREIAWLVGELNGVRVYVNGNNIIMTTQDLQP